MVTRMIHNLLFLPIIFLLVSCSSPIIDDGTEPELHQLNLNKINQITITEVGVTAQASKDSAVICENFTLTQKDVEEYFKIANRVSRDDYNHLMDWSPCYVTGEIRLNDGTVGLWGIHQYRGGTLNFGTEETIYMFCPKCRAEKFDSPECFPN